MRLWLEQKRDNSETPSKPVLSLPPLPCSKDQVEQLQAMARSTTIGIWRMKRAKVLLGAIDGKTLERLVLDVRVPPETIVKTVEAFSKEGLASLQTPNRKSTLREARVEKMLEMLEKSSRQRGEVWKSFTVRYIGTDFNGPMIRKMREIVRNHQGAPRVALAEMICREFNLYSPTGKCKSGTLVGILTRMDMDNLVQLPESAMMKSYRNHPMPQHPLLQAREKHHLHHRDLEPLVFTWIRDPDENHLWRDMMSRYHYLKRPRLFGAQIRYLIWGSHSNNALAGSESGHRVLLGAIGFSQAAWRLADRDIFIGWDDQQRERGLKRIIGNSRFLILPWIQCPNLASMILGQIAKRVAKDWEAAYGVQPVLLETFVQEDRYAGTCYRAANWIQVGRTVGYSYFSSQKRNRATKAIFLYPLWRDFRKELCQAGLSEQNGFTRAGWSERPIRDPGSIPKPPRTGDDIRPWCRPGPLCRNNN